jgi:hypothetical protein
LIQDKLIFGGVAGSSTSEKMGEVLSKKTRSLIENQGELSLAQPLVFPPRILASNSRFRGAIKKQAQLTIRQTGTHSETPLNAVEVL